MKDKNGIEKECKNCDAWGYCKEYSEFRKECKLPIFQPRVKVYETRIEELQNSLDETENKLTETIKLLGERSRECGELQAHNEVLQRRIEEFSMELLDQNMRDNKDVLERLKNWEEYLDKDLSKDLSTLLTKQKASIRFVFLRQELKPKAENLR